MEILNILDDWIAQLDNQVDDLTITKEVLEEELGDMRGEVAFSRNYDNYEDIDGK